MANELGPPRAPLRRAAEDQTLDLGDLAAFFRRQAPFVAGWAAGFLGLGLAYMALTTPTYTATTTILLDPKAKNVLQHQGLSGDAPVDSAAIDSQVEVLKSESVALSTIRSLKLVDDPEFGASGGALSWLLQSLPFSGGPPSETYREQRALRRFERNLKVRRVGMSYVVELAYASIDRDKSAEIANSLADSYMVGELEARYQATRRASRWLQERIGELREQASAADQAVQTFKAENNIVDTGRGLIGDQQLSDVNGQLTAAKAATAEAKAKLDRIEAIAREKTPDAAVTDATVADALRNDVITRLRAQYLDLSQKQADWSTRYGANHAAVQGLRSQMREIQKSIDAEIRRIAETYRSEYEIARKREASLEQSLSSLVGQSNATAQAQIKLRDLESSAQTARNLYQNFLQREAEATQQQTFPINEARVLSSARPPLQKSWPLGSIVLPASLLAGLSFGVGLGALRERSRRLLRSAGDVEKETGLPCLGLVPRILATGPAAPGREDEIAARRLPAHPGLLRHVSEAPFSRGAESLRGAKVAVDLRTEGRASRVVAVASAAPGEGKSTIAANLAHLMAQAGQRTLLIDGDLRNPSLTRQLTPQSERGLAQALEDGGGIEAALWSDPVTGLVFLPATGRSAAGGLDEARSASLTSSNRLRTLLTSLREAFDYIVVDLPPAGPVVDVRAVAGLTDAIVGVAEWGATPARAVREALGEDPEIQRRLVGVLLNKADLARLAVYDRRSDLAYGRYYVDDAQA
jgi:succinoglycan biosynthesis transport protein ExoP